MYMYDTRTCYLYMLSKFCDGLQLKAQLTRVTSEKTESSSDAVKVAPKDRHSDRGEWALLDSYTARLKDPYCEIGCRMSSLTLKFFTISFLGGGLKYFTIKPLKYVKQHTHNVKKCSK